MSAQNHLCPSFPLLLLREGGFAKTAAATLGQAAIQFKNQQPLFINRAIKRNHEWARIYPNPSYPHPFPTGESTQTGAAIFGRRLIQP